MSDRGGTSGRIDFARLIDRMLAPELVARGGEPLRTLRIGLSALLLSAALIPFGIVDSTLRGKWLSVAALSLVLVCLTLSISWVRRHGWSERVGHLATLCATAYPLSAIVAGASIHDPALMVLMATPISAFFLVGRGGGWVWCGACVASFVVMGAATEDSAVAIHERVWMLSSLTVTLTTAAYAFERLRRAALAELERARNEAQASAEAKSQFLANMSHEIRTPMNGVLGMLGIVLDTRLDADQRSYVETAHASGIALLDLLNDILDFSKMNAQQMLLEATPFDLRSVIEDVLDQVAVQAGKKDLELAARYVPGTPTHVLGDHGRIRQVLLNLLSNAVKFTDSGHVLVTVEHAPRSAGPPQFRCSVEDTGIGIPAEKHALIFDVFRQVDGSTTRERAGTGLGLAIVRELVQLMGGQLGLESALGKGSKFWFELPLPLAVDRPPEPELTADLAGLRVLVVDDHWVNRWVLQEQLVRWGFRTEQCGSAERALELLREAAARGEPYDLALLDYQMPRVDGMGLARAMMADASIRGVTWVMLSSIMQRPSDEALREVHCAAYLVKPVRQSDLMNVLAAVWARRGDPEALPLTRPPRAMGEPEVLPAAQGLRVLVVEDNAVNQKVAQRMLMDLGCRVDVAGDGKEALELIESVPYDLVFMDVQMPHMDGLDATRELRRREAGTGRHRRVVAMTAHAMPEDRDRCMSAGMDGYLSKPIKRRDLVRELRKSSGPASAVVRVGASEVSDVKPAWAAEPRWDVQWLRENYAADDETLRSLVELFVAGADERLVALRAAVRDDDVGAQETAHHALLGICGTIRAMRMRALLAASPRVSPQALRELGQEYAALHACFVREVGLPPRSAASPAASAS